MTGRRCPIGLSTTTTVCPIFVGRGKTCEGCTGPTAAQGFAGLIKGLAAASLLVLSLAWACGAGG